MVLRNISYKNPEIKREIDGMVGESFSWAERWRMGGIGSPRMLVLASSDAIDKLLAVNNHQRFCSIELRPKGIIIAFRSRLDTYGLMIPYRNLGLFKSDDSLRVYSGSHFIQLDLSKTNPSTHRFLSRLMTYKSKVLQDEAMPH